MHFLMSHHHSELIEVGKFKKWLCKVDNYERRVYHVTYVASYIIYTLIATILTKID